jgi:hypothetical protein
MIGKLFRGLICLLLITVYEVQSGRAGEPALELSASYVVGENAVLLAARNEGARPVRIFSHAQFKVKHAPSAEGGVIAKTAESSESAADAGDILQPVVAVFLAAGQPVQMFGDNGRVEIEVVSIAPGETKKIKFPFPGNLQPEAIQKLQLSLCHGDKEILVVSPLPLK